MRVCWCFPGRRKNRETKSTQFALAVPHPHSALACIYHRSLCTYYWLHHVDMKVLIQRRLLFLVVWLLACLIPQANALLFNLSFFESLINSILQSLNIFGLWNNVAQGLCDSFQGALPSVFVNCQCTGSYQVGKGLGGDFFCGLGGEICLIEDEGKKGKDNENR